VTKAAAIFDLDRTLVRGASGPTISQALREVGVIGDRVPGEGLVYRIFEVFGENRPTMFLTRQLVRAATGWDRQLCLQAAELVAERLESQVLPFARAAIDEHREAGRLAVLATTTPHDLIAPFAERVGFDHVLATRWNHTKGVYDGTIDGDFVWGRGKAKVVKRWAGEAGVELADSWAYSDSWYDLPLLRSVGHPVAVNPDPRLALVAPVLRWPIVFFDVPPGVPKLAGLVEPQRLLMALARPELFPYVRFDIAGVEKVPRSGPAILAANHRSYFDPLAIGFLLARVGRPVRFLGKKEVFEAPIVGELVRALGGIRVDRGTGSDEPLREAARALSAGELVAIMPQGTIPRGPAFFEPELKGRWGTARLAAMTKVPVIPIGLWGTEKVWPRSSRIPDLAKIVDPPTVRVRVGDPVKLRYRDLDEDTKAIMAAIVDLLPPEARVRRKPTEEELRKTFPPGYRGDPDREFERRPGRDL
jgi:putative phosphoserine phosphatase/1-acylglycerol-3-phosphate O-acyltransferase